MRTLTVLSAALIVATAVPSPGQWQMQESHTTASLRGIHAVGGGVAWASGTEGTVLKTIDGGKNWQKCTVPPQAEKLDFRGVQAFDANTAIVMSSGTGDLSRLYKTDDACKTWKLLVTNPDKEGFWDAYRIDSRNHLGVLVGDPVSGHLPIWVIDRIDSASPVVALKHKPRSRKGEAVFAASNQSVFVADAFFDFWIATGGTSGSRIIKRINHDFDSFGFDTFPSVRVPIGRDTQSSGIFALDFRPNTANHKYETEFLVGAAVGGDYQDPNGSSDIAARTDDGGKTWVASSTQPHGYRSAVAFSSTDNAWITVGPNGTDVSTDDGRNWRALHPGPHDDPDADKQWNALSLPFVVGPKGRIAILRPDALAAR